MAKTLAVDWGRAKLGLAVSDDLGIIAQGLASLPRTSEERDLQAIEAHVRRLEVNEVVVGLPKNMDGTLGASAEAALALAETLRARLGVPVHLWDERLSTLAAERTLLGAGMRRQARRSVVDQVAATLILQGFLDRRRAGIERGES
jgi:putative Holliday junction resolvase